MEQTSEQCWNVWDHDVQPPATVFVTTGCVHEHVVSGPVCGQCVEWLRAGAIVCHPCRDSLRRPHECTVHLIKLEELVAA